MREGWLRVTSYRGIGCGCTLDSCRSIRQCEWRLYQKYGRAWRECDSRRVRKSPFGVLAIVWVSVFLQSMQSLNWNQAVPWQWWMRRIWRTTRALTNGTRKPMWRVVRLARRRRGIKVRGRLLKCHGTNFTKAFTEYFNHTVKESTRVVVEDDPIVYLPPFPWFSVKSVPPVVCAYFWFSTFVGKLLSANATLMSILQHRWASRAY